MAKFSGKVGLVTESVETRPGVWEESIKEVHVTGDVIGLSPRYDGGSKVNDDINLNQRISIIYNQSVLKDLAKIAWVEYMGVKWKVTGFEVQRPRVILSVGGVWSGQ